MTTQYIYDVDTRTVIVEIHCESVDQAIEYYNAYYNDDENGMTSTPAFGCVDGLHYADSYCAIEL